MKSLNEFTIFTSQSKIDTLSLKLVIINVKYQGVRSAFWVKLNWLWQGSNLEKNLGASWLQSF